jgi:hypothetical protein
MERNRQRIFIRNSGITFLAVASHPLHQEERRSSIYELRSFHGRGHEASQDRAERS